MTKPERAKVTVLAEARIAGTMEPAAVTLLLLDLQSGETPGDKIKAVRETLAAFDWVLDQ